MFGRAAPKHVYSAFLANHGTSSRTATVQYLKADDTAESVTKQVQPGASVYFEQKTTAMDGWNASARIASITVKEGGATLKEPFDGVNAPTKDYHFVVDGSGVVKGSLSKK